VTGSVTSLSYSGINRVTETFEESLETAKKEDLLMTQQVTYSTYQEVYEYHGNTDIVVTRKQAGNTVWRDWILFDSAEEASDYFHSNCCAGEA
jgi:hypothetical protein